MKIRAYYRSTMKDFVAYAKVACNEYGQPDKVMGWSGTSAKLAIASCRQQLRRRKIVV